MNVKDDLFKDIGARTSELEREAHALAGMTDEERAKIAMARDAKRFAPEREKEAMQARLDNAREKAVEILTNGDPRKHILDTVKTQHIGDFDSAEGILIGTTNQSIANSKGIQSALHGESGEGKSHAARAMLHLFPNRCYMIASLSDKALFYMDVNELHEGMTIFSDDAKVSEGIESIIKRSTAFFQEETIHKVADKKGSSYVAKTLKIPARINWLITSVDSQGSEQLVNRQIGFGVDATSSQDDAVMKFELEKARDGLPEFIETEAVLVCREIIANIKEDELGNPRLFTVKIPFADRIEWNDKKNRRNLPIFLDMVKGYAVLNFKQREMVANALIATEDDFKAAARLYNSRGGFQQLHVTEREKEMLMHIVQNDGELTTSELMDKLGVSRLRVAQIADRLETVLPSFEVEKRSVSIQDPHDTGKHTVTQRNYYIYAGTLDLEKFGLVVSLKPDKDEPDKSGTVSTVRPLLDPLLGQKNETEKAQNGEITPKEDNNNNKDSNNSIALLGDIHEYIGNDTFSTNPLYSLSGPNSAHEELGNNFINKSDSVLDDAEGTDHKLTVPLTVPYQCPNSGLAALANEVKDILEKWRSTIRCGKKQRVDRSSFIEAIGLQLFAKHPERDSNYCIKFIERLSVADRAIESSILELTDG